MSAPKMSTLKPRTTRTTRSKNTAISSSWVCYILPYLVRIWRWYIYTMYVIIVYFIRGTRVMKSRSSSLYMRSYPGLAGLIVFFGRALDHSGTIVVILACHALHVDYGGYGGRHVPPKPRTGGRRCPAKSDQCKREPYESLTLDKPFHIFITRYHEIGSTVIWPVAYPWLKIQQTPVPVAKKKREHQVYVYHLLILVTTRYSSIQSFLAGTKNIYDDTWYPLFRYVLSFICVGVCSSTLRHQAHLFYYGLALLLTQLSRDANSRRGHQLQQGENIATR